MSPHFQTLIAKVLREVDQQEAAEIVAFRKVIETNSESETVLMMLSAINESERITKAGSENPALTKCLAVCGMVSILKKMAEIVGNSEVEDS